MSVLTKTRASVRRARQMVTASLDLAEVPDGHPVETKVTSAFIQLEEALNKLPRAARNASALHDEDGVFVIPGSDMRDWPTFSGRSASEVLMPQSRLARRIASHERGTVLAGREVSSRRVIAASDYLRALEDAVPVATPTDFFGGYDDSNTTVALAR
jgi:ketosteroid isomerase-like protein